MIRLNDFKDRISNFFNCDGDDLKDQNKHQLQIQVNKHSNFKNRNIQDLTQSQIGRKPRPKIFRQQQNPQQSMTNFNTHINTQIQQNSIICAICQMQYNRNSQEFINLCNCQHQHCNKCVTEHIKSTIYNFQQIVCPQVDCKPPLNKINSQSLFFKSLPQQILNKYKKIQKQFFLSKDPFLRSCPTPDCQGIMAVIQNQPMYCQICKKQYCQKCNQKWHKDPCYDQQWQKLIKIFNLKKCTGCGHGVQRIDGCNYMKCQICRSQFCYVCGLQWKSVPGHKHYFCPNKSKIQSPVNPNPVNANPVNANPVNPNQVNPNPMIQPLQSVRLTQIRPQIQPVLRNQMIQRPTLVPTVNPMNNVNNETFCQKCKINTHSQNIRKRGCATIGWTGFFLFTAICCVFAPWNDENLMDIHTVCNRCQHSKRVQKANCC